MIVSAEGVLKVFHLNKKGKKKKIMYVHDDRDAATTQLEAHLR